MVARMIHATADESFADHRPHRRGGGGRRGGRPAGRGAGDLRRPHGRGRHPGGGRTAVLLPRRGPDRAGRATPVRPAAIARRRPSTPNGALWVIGNAPTALADSSRCIAAGAVGPAAVIGLPVGYVGAAEAKAALWASPLRADRHHQRRPPGRQPGGGRRLNALVRLAGDLSEARRYPAAPR